MTNLAVFASFDVLLWDLKQKTPNLFSKEEAAKIDAWLTYARTNWGEISSGYTREKKDC